MQCQDASTELALVSYEMGAAVYGTWVVSDVRLRLPGDACWFIYNRKTAVHFLVYFMWVHLVYSLLCRNGCDCQHVYWLCCYVATLLLKQLFVSEARAVPQLITLLRWGSCRAEKHTSWIALL